MPKLTSHKKVRGLDLNSNPFVGSPIQDSGGPRASTVIADNCVVNRQGMLGNRRGFDYFTPSTSQPVTAMFEYQNLMVQHQAVDSTLWRCTASSGTRTAYSGTYTAMPNYRLDATVGRGSLFFPTTAGPMKLDKVTNTPSRAGLTKGLDVRVSTTGTGAGFLSGFGKAAYHISWTRTDANMLLVRSDVSSAVIVTNSNRQTVTSITRTSTTATVTTPAAHGFTTGDTIHIAGADQAQYNGDVTITSTGSTTFTYSVAGSPVSPATGTTITAEKYLNVNVAFTVPFDVQTGDTYEVWRTLTIDASAADPGDDCFLISTSVYGGAAGATVTYTDITADDILATGTPLYTNASEEGATQGNERPPVCVAVTTYKDYTVYANTALDHQITPTMLAVVGMVAGTSTITITRTDAGGARTYKFNTSENVSTQTAQLFTGGTSNAANIENTARSLCHVINGDSAGYWYAEYLSGVNDNPGIFRIWARSPLSAAFALTANSTATGNEFSPAFPTSGQTVVSQNDARLNRFFFSKQFEPDHVPLLNFIDVGRSDQPIYRVISLRDAIFVIKADGVWFLQANALPATPSELDTNCHCIAPASAVTVDNQIYMLSNKGFVSISQAGTNVISFPIEPVVMGSVLALTNLLTVAFGMGHESERLYICWLPTGSGDTYCKEAYVYHVFLQDWTHWTKPASAAIGLNSNYNMYIASGQENAILRERKNGNVTDYSDEELAITITAQATTTLTVTWPSSVFTPSAGLTIHQGSVVSKVLTATFVSGTTWTFVIDRQVTYTLAAATARMPIFGRIRLAPDPCDDQGAVKTFYKAVLLLEKNTVTQATIELGTNESPFLNTYALTQPISGGWGSNPWGNTGWGDLDSPVRTIPWSVDVPVPDNTGETITVGWIHNVSQEPFSLAQCTVWYDDSGQFVVT